MNELEIRTFNKNEFVDITDKVEEYLEENGYKNGILYLNVLHTTAARTIDENVDPHVKFDLLNALEAMVPNIRFMHAEGNSDAHLKSSLLGTTLTLPVNDGKVLRGVWQGVYFCEFDGPRIRNVCLTFVNRI